jgi:hypothetical protein
MGAQLKVQEPRADFTHWPGVKVSDQWEDLRHLLADRFTTDPQAMDRISNEKGNTIWGC